MYINDELGRPWPILCLGQIWSHDFAWKKMDFYEIVAGYDLKIDRCRHPNEDKCSIGQGHSLTLPHGDLQYVFLSLLSQLQQILSITFKKMIINLYKFGPMTKIATMPIYG